VQNFTGKSQADAPAGYSPKTVAEREAEMKKSKQAKADASQKKAEQDNITETKSRNCEAARQNVRSLEEGVRITAYDAKGERTVMDDETRAKKLEESRQAITSNCN
jgi:hypothetical protein